MHTEEEARKKWCPHTRNVLCIPGSGNSAPRNRVTEVGKDDKITLFDSNLAGCHCISSDCMAWRWGDAGNPYKPKSEGGILLPKELWPGYCGLAGKP